MGGFQPIHSTFSGDANIVKRFQGYLQTIM